MNTSGLTVVLVALTVAAVLGWVWQRSNGRFAAVAAQSHARLTDAQVPELTPGRPTVVQFSSPVCAPCRSTQRLITDILATREDVDFVEVDATERLDLAEQLSVARTPTVLVLDREGFVRHRASGAPTKTQILDALAEVAA